MNVAVLVSGGVDSAVALRLLKDQGHNITAFYLKIWLEDELSFLGDCPWEEDLSYVRKVCEELNVPLEIIPLQKAYRDRIVSYVISEVKAGRTPNPDILCNREIKFRAFLDYACELGADLIATGHYVRRQDQDGHTRLQKGLDNNKDQSYFLHQVGEAELARTLFPIGELEKPDVRRIAEEHGLATHAKKDSTGICFIGERRFADFLKQYLPAQPGNIETPDGEVIGQHAGLMYYTIGQRQGLRIGGLKNHPEEPWFAAFKDLERNVLIAVQGKQNDLLFSDWLTATDIFWINGDRPSLPHRCKAKVRYRQADQDCVIEAFGDAGYRVRFDQPQRAVTPGQSVVFYDVQTCLGGGVIETTGKTGSE